MDYTLDQKKTAEICKKIISILQEDNPEESYTALITVLCNVFIMSGCEREDFLRDLGKSWDFYKTLHDNRISRQP